MDLTPKALKKKTIRKRFKAPGVVRHWNNPFQKAILLIALVSYLGVSGIERFKERSACDAQLALVRVLRTELAGLNATASTIHSNQQGKVERWLDQDSAEWEKLQAINAEVDQRFAELNERFASIAYRYQLKNEIQQPFLETITECLNAALARQEFDRARRLFNSSDLKELLTEIKPAVEGKGRLEIQAGTNVLEVIVWSLKSDGPRLVVSNHEGRSQTFPFVIPKIENGSHLFFVTRSDRGLSPYPVYVKHGEEKQVELQVPEHIPEGMSFVPGGTFLCGGESSELYREHERFLPPFFIKRKEVSLAEYRSFWNTLSPELQARFNAKGSLSDERLKPNHPIVGISLEAAEAFCAWKSLETGATIRLPTAFEWEKAARGVDGRTYPWGHYFEAEANLAHVQGNEKGKAKYPFFAPGGSFSRDISVYNVYDMAGNAREFTASRMPNGQSGYQVKGGSAFLPETFMPCAHVSTASAEARDVGFRYVQEVH